MTAEQGAVLALPRPLLWGDAPHVSWRLDADGAWWEARREIVSVVGCPACGDEQHLEAETDCWTEGGDGRWHHDGYGPAFGDCCGLLLADWWEGPHAFVLPA